MTANNLQKTLISFMTCAVIILSMTLPGYGMPQPPVTREEALALAHRIEAAAEKRDGSIFITLFDGKVFGGRVARAGGFPADDATMPVVIKGFMESFGPGLFRPLGANGTYRLIKVYEKEGTEHMLFRIYYDNRVNYHDFELLKKQDGVKAADMYIYMSGEPISKTLAEMLQLAGNNANSNTDFGKLSKLKAIKDLVAGQHYEEAMKMYDGLPADVRHEKTFQMIHIQIASKMSNDVYLHAMQTYHELYPNEPNMYLLMVDAYILQKDYPKALESVNKLDSMIDRDPYQDYERGLIYLVMKDTANSITSLERLHRDMPELAKGTIQLIAEYDEVKQVDKAIQLINQARDSSYLTAKQIELIYAKYPDLKK